MSMRLLDYLLREPDEPDFGPEATNELDELAQAGHPLLRALSVASLVLGATALGLVVGRELRLRYKFKRRTPYDFYAKAGDPVSLTEYGMGI